MVVKRLLRLDVSVGKLSKLVASVSCRSIPRVALLLGRWVCAMRFVANSNAKQMCVLMIIIRVINCPSKYGISLAHLTKSAVYRFVSVILLSIYRIHLFISSVSNI